MTSVNGNIYKILNNICRDPPERLTQFGLSRRETEILGWIVHGKTNPEIATILSISVRTIHKHVERLYLKLEVENRHAAISHAQPALVISNAMIQD